MSDRYPVHVTIFDLKGGRKGRQIDARDDLMWGWPNEENVAEYAMTYMPKNDPDRVIEVDDGSLVWRFRTGRMAGQRTVRLLGKSASKSRRVSHATKKSPAQLQREIDKALASSRRPRLGTWPTFPVGAQVDVLPLTMFGEKRSDGYEGTWYVLEANSRDGDHLLNKSPHDDGRGVWVHVSRLTEHGSKKAHATKKSTKAAKHERAMEKMRALRPVQERRNPAELSPIALVTEIRQAEFALRRNPSAEKQRYLDELLAEERSRESRYG